MDTLTQDRLYYIPMQGRLTLRALRIPACPTKGCAILTLVN